MKIDDIKDIMNEYLNINSPKLSIRSELYYNAFIFSTELYFFNNKFMRFRKIYNTNSYKCIIGYTNTLKEEDNFNIDFSTIIDYNSNVPEEKFQLQSVLNSNEIIMIELISFMYEKLSTNLNDLINTDHSVPTTKYTFKTKVHEIENANNYGNQYRHKQLLR